MGKASKIALDERIKRHLAAGHVMSHMIFPDRAELCNAAEIIFRVKFADWWSEQFITRLGKEEIRRLLLDAGSQLPQELPRPLADPCAWTKSRVFEHYLDPFGGVISATIALKDSPSEHTLEQEWMRRWFAVVCTGRLLLLIGSINQHTHSGASLNKAIYVLRETDGNNTDVKAVLKEFKYPAINDSSLKNSWRTFKPVAHLCAAYLASELLLRKEMLFRTVFQDFGKFRKKPPVLFQPDVFLWFCTVAACVEDFVTSFRPHGQQQALISKEEIYSLDNFFRTDLTLRLSFPPLLEEEIAALEGYRAPKTFI